MVQEIAAPTPPAPLAPVLDPLLLRLVEAMAVADVERDLRDRLHFVWVYT